MSGIGAGRASRRRLRLLVALLGTLLAIVLSIGVAQALFTATASNGSNTFTTDTLDPPTALTATGGGCVSLNWTATADTYATGHRVFRGTGTGGPYTQIAEITPRTSTTYGDTPVSGGTYYYVARSFYQNWESTSSNEASATVSASSTISFRASASAGAPSGTLTLTISKPAGTVQNDVMIASIAVRPDTATITAPAGWTLVRRIDNASANANSLAVYYKVAGASEPASYTWTFSTSTGSAGGIQSFSGVDTTTPINVENGQTTPSGLSHATPSVTTTMAGTMLVTSHAFASAATWTPPGGMTEAFDAASVAVPNSAGISIEGNYLAQAAAGATGSKTATASNDADAGNTHILALSPKTVSFRASASAGAPSGTLTLTISKPAGTVQNDVMIASIAVRPDTATITAPAGWTLVRRIDNASANANSLAVYYKVAGASEPASYTWTFSTSTGSAGGIQSFSGVDTTTPINVENGQTTPSGLSHATPSVTTTVTNTMPVTSHAFSSAATWTPPAGMTEAFDVASVAVPNTAGISIEGNYASQATACATGTKTATASNDADVGNAHILALNPAP